MNSNEKINAAMAKMDADPELAKAFDAARRIDFPQAKTRRDAAALGLIALEAKRDAALASVRAKAMKYTANVAAKTFKKAVAAVATITKPRAEKRVGSLPLDQWAFGHLASAAQAGDQLAVAEINRRGFEINANQTFRKKN
jgi:hypothetical protein